MPGTSEYTCSRCGHKVEALAKSFDLGPRPSAPDDPKRYKGWEPETLRWLEANTKVYVCDRCWLWLTVPLVLSRADWEVWKCSNLESIHPYTEYPFLNSIVSRIERALTDGSKLRIELGAISCPYCATELSVRRDFRPTCPKCGSTEMSFSGGGIASVRGNWPPII